MHEDTSSLVTGEQYVNFGKIPAEIVEKKVAELKRCFSITIVAETVQRTRTRILANQQQTASRP